MEERSPEVAAPPLLDFEGKRRRAEANALQVDEAFLTRVFSKFASFVPGSAEVKRNADGTTRGYGYVTFSERRDVEAAKAEFDDQFIGTCRVRVSPFWRNLEARRLSEEQLMQRCEMRSRLMNERMRQEEAEERRRRAVLWS